MSKRFKIFLVGLFAFAIIGVFSTGSLIVRGIRSNTQAVHMYENNQSSHHTNHRNSNSYHHTNTRCH